MLNINNLTISIKDKLILKNFNLNVKAGEVHVLMGPNGSGKSSLSFALTGNPLYTIDCGTISYKEENLLEMEPYERAQNGIFMSFQHPPEISGIKNNYFLKQILENNLEHKNKEKPKPSQFIERINQISDSLSFNKSLFKRNLNENFSGGEKKKNEILQMNLLDPSLVILDEIDSGLDIDALKSIGNNIQKSRSSEKAFIIITHYPRLLKYIDIDHVHVMNNGKIVKSGSEELASEIENNGYESYIKQ